jgi:hypothetical protein
MGEELLKTSGPCLHTDLLLRLARGLPIELS